MPPEGRAKNGSAQVSTTIFENKVGVFQQVAESSQKIKYCKHVAADSKDARPDCHCRARAESAHLP